MLSKEGSVRSKTLKRESIHRILERRRSTTNYQSLLVGVQVGTFYKTVGHYLAKLEICKPCHPAIPLLSRGSYVHNIRWFIHNDHSGMVCNG